MKKRIDFTKMNGLGNDYIYVDADRFPIADPAAFSIRWSQPHTGIGSDGLIMIRRSQVADFAMRIFNADGTEALMCGNGSRCVGKWVYDKGLTDKTDITLDTLAGIKRIRLQLTDGEVVGATVDMGAPLLANPRQVATADGTLEGNRLTASGLELHATYVCMGNPHCVVFIDDLAALEAAATGQSAGDTLSTAALQTLGRQLEFHPLFPERANIEFVQPLPDGSLRMRVWERGSGVTQACGTGACATAVAASLTGHAGRESVVRMDGGDLHIRWDEKDGHVYMTGPAETSFEGYVLTEEPLLDTVASTSR
ncbi:MAG: diaminopimelate epimerase [Bacteroidaceae bacterium]|nr:diaminopimelate epimerase [Bacteroidaceae bacterium]